MFSKFHLVLTLFSLKNVRSLHM
ncbi:hypothetical protein HID58_037359 [Brassica napus]|uniref:Uncharacterized protein n=1 Tax=Brassica napus TaxID=3708 RepID=A0ABQ8AKR0_BRANA|nr:hypothetical protein HID58_055563 [Brassica napus]KAH0905532.1 hypothetical protein HID58_037359 [Brassica napus]